jgi:hypothetical protein
MPKQPSLAALLARIDALEIRVQALVEAQQMRPAIQRPWPPDPAVLSRHLETTSGATLSPSPRPLLPREPDPSWLPVIHIGPPGNPCGQPAYYVTRKILVGREKPDLALMRVRAAGEARWHDPDIGAMPMCSSCGLTIDPYRSDELDFSQARAVSPAGEGLDLNAGSVPPQDYPVSVIDPPPPGSVPLHTPEAEAHVLSELTRLAQDLGFRGHTSGSREGA